MRFFSHSPEIISDFSPVPQHYDPARRETQKVFNVVLALERKKVKKVQRKGEIYGSTTFTNTETEKKASKSMAKAKEGRKEGESKRRRKLGRGI